ncbi:MAG TPA: thioredoxin [Helicobacteraceae bacterium]|nr:thioredoxin [Helicobacteraceae bacterium]
MRKLSTLFLLLLTFTLSAVAEEPMLRETPYAFVKESIGKGKPHFVEVGSDSCHSCQIMGRLLYKVQKEYPHYNIDFVNVKREREAAYELKIQMIPTQLIFDKTGQEVYRHVGPLDTTTLMSLFTTYQFDKE